MKKLNGSTRKAMQRRFDRNGHPKSWDVTEEYTDRSGRIFWLDTDTHSDTYMHVFWVASQSGTVRDDYFPSDWDDFGKLYED